MLDTSNFCQSLYVLQVSSHSVTCVFISLMLFFFKPFNFESSTDLQKVVKIAESSVPFTPPPPMVISYMTGKTRKLTLVYYF